MITAQQIQEASQPPHLLRPSDSAWMRDRSKVISCHNRLRETKREMILGALTPNVTIPAFTASVVRLREMLSHGQTDLQTIAEAAKLDPGLSARLLRMASANGSSKTTTCLDEAVRQVGLPELRKSTTTYGVIEQAPLVRVKVRWDMYRLHSILVARLTEQLAAAYQPITGKEYLAGLLHDVGKLFLEHHFPRDFEAVVHRAMERGEGMHAAEQHLLGITHAEISALLCERWQLHRDIVRAVRFHHEPASPFNRDALNSPNQKLLAACVAVADTLANIVKANIQGARALDGVNFEELPEWRFLQEHFTPIASVDLNVPEELAWAFNCLTGKNPSSSHGPQKN